MSLGTVAKWPRVIRSVSYTAGRGLSVDLVASEVTRYEFELRLDRQRKTIFITLHEKDGVGDHLLLQQERRGEPGHARRDGPVRHRRRARHLVDPPRQGSGEQHHREYVHRTAVPFVTNPTTVTAG